MANLSTYPFSLETDFEPQRSRLATFFRILLVIPHLIVLAILGLAAWVSVVIAWFAVVITGRYPGALYRFNRGVLTLGTQVNGYMFLLTDRFPPFALGETNHPVRLAGQPEPPAESSRPLVFFRLFTAIPWLLLNYVYVLIAELAAVVSWFVILFTGRQLAGLQRVIHMGNQSSVHVMTYMTFLTDVWPPIEPDMRLEPRLGGGDGGAGGGLPPAGGFAEPVAPPPPPATPESPRGASVSGEDRPEEPGAPGITSGDPLKD